MVFKSLIDALLQLFLLFADQKNSENSQHQQFKEHEACNQLTADCSRPR